MPIGWAIFLGVSLAVSLFMFTFLQVRSLWRERKVDEASRRSPSQIYWSDLSVIERLLTYAGLTAFLLTVAARSILRMMWH
jgi:hypothetical protein